MQNVRLQTTHGLLAPGECKGSLAKQVQQNDDKMLLQVSIIEEFSLNHPLRQCAEYILQ